MTDLKALAGDIMGFYKSFSGSRPAFNSDNLLIVRGKSVLRDSYTTMPEKLEKIMKFMNGEEIDLNSETATKFISYADEEIRKKENIQTGTDTNGLNRMKKEYEAMGADVQMKMFKVEGSTILITTWKDKNDLGPMYVEAVLEKTEN